MLILSKKVEYGLMALLHMDVTDSGVVTSSKDMAEQYHLPVDLLGKVTQALARFGLIEAVHGAKGGYRLAKNLEDISLGDVIEAIEGPVRLVRCHHDARDCVQFSACTLKEPIQQLHEQLQGFLFGVSIGQFRKQALEPQEASRS